MDTRAVRMRHTRRLTLDAPKVRAVPRLSRKRRLMVYGPLPILKLRLHHKRRIMLKQDLPVTTAPIHESQVSSARHQRQRRQNPALSAIGCGWSRS